MPDPHSTACQRPTLKKYSAALLSTGMSVRMVRRKRSETELISVATSSKGSTGLLPTFAHPCAPL